jgi:hypothetical protein
MPNIGPLRSVKALSPNPRRTLIADFMETLAGIILLSVLLAHPQPAAACSCERDSDGGIKPPPPEWIFVGVVQRIERIAIQRDANSEALTSYLRICFVVESVSKGYRTDGACVRTGVGDGDCGYPFEVGGRYQVFAHRANRPWSELVFETGFCDETRKLPKSALAPTVPIQKLSAKLK